ncbi:hypothetical protein FSARC_10794 [Fusarium sarcochroum]|uniref:DUF6536 domain-containing protein n=1 Tax=Fusarium sarcochroum TaxID=1208366 RepID=A0A8H4TJN5_9HYPO|nr:hypothetical protein FSARC_10794 [Fusarium sarcochroum]
MRVSSEQSSTADVDSVSRRPAWLRLATINIILLIVLALILLAVLIYGCVRAGSLNAAFVLFQGPCSRSQTINISVHLLLNIFSTLILASSNFFMQIIGAPSRDVVDRAHARSGWVNIGVPSIRNFIYIGPAKFACWFILACSSIPIHLFFNSLVFQVEEVRADFGMTIATEDFLDGASYHQPGASLWNTAVPTNCTTFTDLKNKECFTKSPYGYGIGNVEGGNVLPATWMNKTSEESMNVSRAASEARDSWQRLDPAECRSKFLFCDKGSGIKGYRSVVLVVKPSEPGVSGWRRDKVFSNMTKSDSKFWDAIIPAKESNSLWYYNHCGLRAGWDNRQSCINTCKTNLGYDQMDIEYLTTVDSGDDTSDPTWKFSFWGAKSLEKHILSAQMRSGFDADYNTLDVSYCLAEREDPQCKIGVSNGILLITTLCVLIKISQCAFFLFRYVLRGTENPLVTPGDAVKSLISRPDRTTVRMCTLEMRDVQFTWERLFGANPKHKTNYDQTDGAELLHGNLEHDFLAPQARQWGSRKKPIFYALPVNVWVRTYVIFLVVLIVAIYYLDKATGARSVTSGAFGNSGINNFVTMDRNYGAADQFTGGFMHLVLLANVPQLILSVSYLQFNHLITRIVMAKEWVRMCTKYRPLRVTDPQGDQISTYRLQLPYKWAAPCILASILLHWLVSNTCYVFMADGGFYSSSVADATVTSGGGSINLDDISFIAIGYSTVAGLIAVIAFAVILCIPLLLSLRKLPGDMVVVGSNSLAIAAACHVSKRCTPSSSSCVLERGAPESAPDIELTTFARDKTKQECDSLVSSVHAPIAQRKVKWGVVRMEDAFYRQLEGEAGINGIKHLSFGTEEDRVETPRPREWYI